MGEKDVDIQKEANEKKIVDADKKPDEQPITIVLKLDLHCAGCAKKVKKSIQYIQGVETVKADPVSNKLTITGKVDPVHIKERVEFKTKKTVEIISPKTKKDDGDKPPEAKSDNQIKPKEPQSTTVVLKISLHCDGCSQKIKRIISKIDGVESVKPDATKNLITVKGTMNVKELIPYLKDKLKRNVDIVPPKKEDDKGGEKLDKNKVGGDDKKEKKGDNNGNDNDKNKNKSDAEKAVDASGGDAKDEKQKNDEAKAATSKSEKKKSDDEVKTTEGASVAAGAVANVDADKDESKNINVINKFEYYRHNPYIYTMPVYNQSYYNQDYGVSVLPPHGYENEGYVNHGYVTGYPHRPPPPPSPMSLHDPRASESDLFSAENPNACSIM